MLGLKLPLLLTTKMGVNYLLPRVNGNYHLPIVKTQFKYRDFYNKIELSMVASSHNSDPQR